MNEDISYKPPIYDQRFQGDQEFTDAQKGIIMRSPDGTRWRITVDNTGALVTTSL